MVLREEFYFEPRVISDAGNIRWYGEKYEAPELLKHLEETVYIRDSGSGLYVYSLQSDEFNEAEEIKAVFTLICKIKKESKMYRYGRRIT